MSVVNLKNYDAKQRLDALVDLKKQIDAVKNDLMNVDSRHGLNFQNTKQIMEANQQDLKNEIVDIIEQYLVNTETPRGTSAPSEATIPASLLARLDAFEARIAELEKQKCSATTKLDKLRTSDSTT